MLLPVKPMARSDDDDDRLTTNKKEGRYSSQVSSHSTLLSATTDKSLQVHEILLDPIIFCHACS